MLTKTIFRIVLICFAPLAFPLDSIVLKIDELALQSVKLDGLKINLDFLSTDESKLSVEIDKLHSENPLFQARAVLFDCGKAQLSQNGFFCDSGSLSTNKSLFGEQRINIKAGISHLQNSDLIESVGLDSSGFPSAKTDAKAFYSWELFFDPVEIDLAQINQAAVYLPGLVMSGQVDLRGSISGINETINTFQLTVSTAQLTMDTDDGRFAAESVDLISRFQGVQKRSRMWTIESRLKIGSGAIYVDPVFVDFTNQPLAAETNLIWDENQNRLRVARFVMDHQGIADVVGVADLSLGEDIALIATELNVHSDRLDLLYSNYFNSFFSETLIDGINPSGRLEAKLKFKNTELSGFDIIISDLDITDQQNRFKLFRGNGSLHWDQSDPGVTSSFSWDDAFIYTIPVGNSALRFEIDKSAARLTQETRLPVLDGSVTFESLEISNLDGLEPSIRVDARIDNVSLEGLTDAFAWPALTGTVSGVIPDATIQSGRLSIDGILLIQAFGGLIEITNFAVADFFGDFPVLTADAQIKTIDLLLLTQKFSFGTMEGKLDGLVEGLRLENWEPVSFNAWFATPFGDHFRRRISQKAIESLSSLGGGSVTDVFSRGVFRFFNFFSYDRIGIGCRLKNQLCEMRGIYPAENGYYIVKGGGIPRIDIIGYNRQVDWDVLLQRLKRIGQSDSAEIQ